MEVKVVFAALVALVALPGNQASLGVLSNALQAFSCGCGCRFYDVGTCETRVKKECETTYQNKCNPVYTKKCNAVPRKECKTTYWNKCEKNQVCKTSYTKKCTKVPNKTCKTVQDKKCHQIPKKECQTKYTKKCKSTPKKNCKTVYQQKCTKQPVQNCKNEQVCHTTYKEECKPTYNYQQSCKSIPQQKCGYKKKCSTSYKENCKDIPKQECHTTYDKKCKDIPHEKCHTTYTEQCESIPKQLCQTTYSQSCKDVPHQNCKWVKDCKKVPEEKCWTVKDIKCHQVSSTSCHKVPNKKCWKVHVKKNRYVKRKECQKCNRWQEKYTTKQKKNNCKLVPRQECRTIYFNDCKKIPQKSCKTKYRNNCKKVQNCETKYNTHCEKPKPTYGKPTYGAPKEVCTQVPYEKCHYSKKCDKVPYEQCSTKYRNQCKKVPQQKCVTLKDLKCTPVWVEVPKTRNKKSCSWGGRKHQDKFCYRRSDYDVLLDAASDYETNIQYIDRIMEDPVDFIETFPANYDGSPNITMDQAGREVTPKHFQENPGFYPQADMAPPPSRGFIPPTMPPMFSGVAQTTPVYRPQGAPKAPAYDPFVRPNPLEFAAAQGQVVVKERPGPALHDLPSPDLTRNTPIVKRQPQQKFFPKESKTQDENNGFMNDPVPFTSSIGSLHNGASRPERSESKTQVQEDFESSFRPGFSQFGNFGPGQTNGRTVWGAPAET